MAALCIVDVIGDQAMKRIFTRILVLLLILGLAGCGNSEQQNNDSPTNTSQPTQQSSASSTENAHSDNADIAVPEEFMLINGGTFQMGSPESEAWRIEDEITHTVTLSDYYISAYEVTHEEYQAAMGTNPSTFSGENLPVESISWMDAVQYCNARSIQEGLTPAYTIEGQNVSWDRSANGYRLPTEAEWEYACRAGTETPFNTETSISADEANYWGNYPYLIEDNYFSQGNLETKPGIYRQTTVAVGSFQPNAWGLYDMHGNVGEWVWDWYGSYEAGEQTDPTGPASGTLRVNRGGGWNDFAKNLRSAYRATLPPDSASFNLGMRLVRNVETGNGSVESTAVQLDGQSGDGILIAYFSWGGNTRGIAQEIQKQTGADLFEIELTTPYSTDYNTVLDQAQRDQNEQARPELSTHVENMKEYDTIIPGYPNWWASIPMPIASFLEEYDFSGKTIIPFCSHGGGRFGQSLTAITKLVPDAALGDGLAVSYSGGSTLAQNVTDWLETNQISLAG